jgi:hypothetical protein
MNIDPISNLPIVCPNIPNNKYSLKLGNDFTNDSAEAVKIRFTVNNFSQFLTVRYAAVLQNGGHSFCEQPRLEFVLYDLGTNSSPVFIKDTFSLIIPTPDSNSISPGWFKSNIANDVLCSNWFPFTFDLTPYYQHNVEISLTLADCALGGHFGYAYIDIDTLNYPQAKFCKGDTKATLIAPSGYANYIWDSVGNTGNPILVGNYDTLIISNPRIETQYKVSYKSPYSSEWRTFYYNLAKGCPQTGVESNTKFANNNVYVYPNPAKNNLTIIGDNLQNTKIELLDLLGRKINYQTITNSSKEVQIDISLLSSQMYFIRTTMDNGMIKTIKFFKE